MSKYSESQLKEYAITIIDEIGEINTTELIAQLRLRMQPDGEDLEILKNRNDDRFSQIARNLVSHLSSSNSLEHFVIVDKNTTPTTFRTKKFDKFKTSINNPEVVKKAIDKNKEISEKFTSRVIDYTKYQQDNKELGDAGERFYLEIERANVAKEFGKVFVKEVIYTAKEHGDGAGYDILSYNKKGIKHIEVKTTKYSLDTSFYMSYNEKVFMESHIESYYLVRVFNFNIEENAGEYRVYDGSMIDTTFDFDTYTYRVTFKEFKK
jgi:hypothetical protein